MTPRDLLFEAFSLFVIKRVILSRDLNLLADNFMLKIIMEIYKISNKSLAKYKINDCSGFSNDFKLKESFSEMLNKKMNSTLLHYSLYLDDFDKLRILMDLFKISEYHMIVILWLLYAKSGIRLYSVFSNRNDYENLSLILGKSPSPYIKDLRSKALIDACNGNNYEIIPDLSEVIRGYQYETELDIKTFFLGKEVKAGLYKEDFDFMLKEYELINKILSEALKIHKPGINILLYGSPGTGKTEFAKLFSDKLPLYNVESITDDVFLRRNPEPTRQDRLIKLRIKQTILQNHTGYILFDEAEDILNVDYTDASFSKGCINTLLETNDIPIIWTTNNIMDVDPAFLRRMTYCLEFKELSEKTQLSIWKRTLAQNDYTLSDRKIRTLNKKYKVAPSIITNAIQTTKMIGGTDKIFEDFIQSVAKVTYKTNNIEKKKEINYLKDYDLSLVNADTDLSILTNRIKACKKLNFSLCLYGEPGTGKSLYARYLAKTLGIKVIHKKVSDLISCMVGDSEQNIAHAFEEARTEKAMLIFDEADSFLQNRSNAFRSWEITLVNEMLTQMEYHQFPFVCTTNLLKTLDEASLRRFTFKIKFDFMTKEMVSKAFRQFFDMECTEYIKGLTPGDFFNVKKRADFLEVKNKELIIKMLIKEVKLKNSDTLKSSIGFLN